MFLFVNSFAVNGPTEEFEKVFNDSAAFLCARPGFVSHRLVRSRKNPGHYLNIAEWKDEESLRAAAALPSFQEHARRLRELATTDPQFFDVVIERQG